MAKILTTAQKLSKLRGTLEAVKTWGSTLAGGMDKAARIAELEAEIAALEAQTALTAAQTSPVVAGTGAAPSGGLVLRSLTTVGNVVTRGALVGARAALVGGVTTTVVLGVAALVLSRLAGGMMADKPVKPGPAMSRQRSGQPNVAPFDARPEAGSDKYYIYAVNTSRWSLYVGRPSDVEGRAAGSFPDGGTGSQPVDYRKLVDKPFASRAEAIEYVKARVTERHPNPYWGTIVKFEGEEYRTLHVGEL